MRIELRAKDLSDFAVAVPLLDEAARLWLDRAIGAVRPDRPWRDRLASAVSGQGGQ